MQVQYGTSEQQLFIVFIYCTIVNESICHCECFYNAQKVSDIHKKPSFSKELSIGLQ